MPYKRGGFKPRRSFKGRARKSSSAWYNRKYSPMDIASKAWRTAKYLKGLINVEHQKLDTVVLAGTQSNIALVSNIVALGTGDTEGSRTGNSILVKYAYLKLSATLNSSASFTKLRVVLVRDKQQIGDTAPAYSDVYDTAGGTQAFLNKLTVGRFDILYDRLVDLDDNNPQRIVEKYIPLNSHIRFNGSASTDVQKGGLYVMLLSDQATNTPSVTCLTRVMYIDN